MEDTKNNGIEEEIEKLKSQFDVISSSYITITDDMESALNCSSKTIQECQEDIKKLYELTTQLVEYSHTTFEQLEVIKKRQDMYDEDMANLHTWTVNTQTHLDNVITQLSLVSEKFDWYLNRCENVYRYKVGDHILTFDKKLNWFRRFMIKLIFGSCEICPSPISLIVS